MADRHLECKENTTWMLRELVIYLLFISYLAAQRPSLGHRRGGSLTKPMLITAFHINSTRRSPKSM